MPVQVPSSLFTLKEAECLFQEEQLTGHSSSLTPMARPAGAGGSSRLPGRHPGQGTVYTYLFQSWFILSVGKCSEVFVADRISHLWGQTHVGDQMKIVATPEDEPFFSSNKKWSSIVPFKLWENWISRKWFCSWNWGQELWARFWLHQEVELP